MIAYFDCFSGICGDMCLGAFVDAGVPFEKLKKELSRLPVSGYRLSAGPVKRAGLAATKIDVNVRNPKSEIRNPKKWKDIQKIIKDSSLSKDIKQKGLKIFKRLFEAEAYVHGEKFDKIHLHELGAVDCIVDIFGTLICLDILGIRNIYSSPVNLGSGAVKTEHGSLPVPAPATAELLKNVPVYSSEKKHELTTPTGAVLISELAEKFGAIPEMSVARIGMGAGNKNFKKHPNVLRIFIGQKTDHRTQNPPSPPFNKGGKGGINNWVTVIETNIDDMNPQVYEYVMEKLLVNGAVDVFFTQIVMKKGRPGIKLTVLCKEEEKEKLIKIIIGETTSIGLRFYKAQRRVMKRRIGPVNTKFGKIKVKISALHDDKLRITPEYEDCKKIAKKLGIPIMEVMQEAQRASSDTKR